MQLYYKFLDLELVGLLKEELPQEHQVLSGHSLSEREGAILL